MFKAIIFLLSERKIGRAIFVLFAAFLAAQVYAAPDADWPTYGGDYQRSGAADEGLTLPLAAAWTHAARHAPEPAWPAPAEHNLSAKAYGLGPTQTYDRAYHAVSAAGRVYFASSAEDAVTCLDAATGGVQWTFLTQGPVRLAPTLADGRVYVGADDGFVYCLDAQTGALVWKHRGGPADRRLPGNERMISLWPIRCGIVVEDGLAYFTAGVFPLRGVFLCAVDAKTGAAAWKKKLDITAQGFLLASPSRLFVPTGRTPFRAFDRETGEPLAKFGKSSSWGRDLVGGCHAILIDKTLATGPSEDGQIHLFDAATKVRLVSTPGIRLIARGKMAYILQTKKLLALDRLEYVKVAGEIRDLENRRKNLNDDLKKLDREKSKAKAAKAITDVESRRQVVQREIAAANIKNSELAKQQRDCVLWETPCDTLHSMILLGDALYTGGEDKVVARSAKDGKTLWQGAVDGKAYGLARSGDRLLVSTDNGRIHCFAPAATRIAEAGDSKNAAPAAPAAPYPDDALTKAYESAAEGALLMAGVKQGYCLVLNAGDGRLAWEIARRSDMQVIVAMSNEKQAEAESRRLSQAGLGGKRLSVHSVGAARLPYPDYCANLVVVDAIGSQRLAVDAREARRILRPYGGAIVVAAREAKPVFGKFEAVKDLEWKPIENAAVSLLGARRRALPGAGEWTHLYADSGNSASSGDQLVKGAMELQWFGRPGPRRMVDRHRKAPAPLFCDGRLFVTGMDYIAAVDAYNGTVLWERDVANSERKGAPHNTSNIVTAKDGLYVTAANQCLRFEPGTGREVARFDAPGASKKAEWSYVSLAGDALFGGVTEPKIAPADQNWERARFGSMACSDQLFALDRVTGEARWSHEPRCGAIVNATVAVDAGRMIFIESADPETRASADGLVPPKVLFEKGAELVALSAVNGKELWRKPVDLQTLWHIVHLSVARDAVVITGSNHKPIEGKDRVRYEQFVFSAKTGEALWQSTQKPTPDLLSTTHGLERQHPAIVRRGGADVVYGPGWACDLQTGKPHDGWKWEKDRKCGTVSMSAHTAFSRFGSTLNPYAFDLETGKKQSLSNITRPGCWINIIPAGGLVLIPEASSGCTCGDPYSIQTSLALRPVGESAP